VWELAQTRVIVVGAGIGGLTSAALLAAQGCDVTVCDMASGPGGKARQDDVAGVGIDAGPTVFTKHDVFAGIFESCGGAFDDAVTLRPATTLARHAWTADERLDLFADPAASEDAIARFAGPAEARGYARFKAAAKRAHDTLDPTFMRASKTSPLGLMGRIGLHRSSDMLAIRPLRNLWSVLGDFFHDPRLRQLFGRYATYCGSSPFEASATLMLIAHVEAEGVWLIEGGMSALSRALEDLGKRNQVRFRYGCKVDRVLVERGRAAGVLLSSGEQLNADRVVVNCDPSALATGMFGGDAVRAVPALRPADRSLSAVTFLGQVAASGFDLSHHNVFFSNDYRAEFDAIRRGKLAAAPSVYLCAQDRGADGAATSGPERVQIIVNAPANGDIHHYSEQEIASCQTQMLETLNRSGLTLQGPLQATTPTEFNRRYPATGGALYGRASHGWAASFRRPGASTRIPGLYCAGGGTHPGAGVPMAALSGQLAAASLLSDLASTQTFHPAATAGGTSTRSATMAPMA
jgi:1-hydroxycarotenoid 3,4-desaturase